MQAGTLCNVTHTVRRITRRHLTQLSHVTPHKLGPQIFGGSQILRLSATPCVKPRSPDSQVNFHDHPFHVQDTISLGPSETASGL